MNSDDRTPCLQPEDNSGEFLYKEADQKGKVIKWGPKDDRDNFLQQTVNCLDACEMAIKCGFAQMSPESMQDQWDQINKKHKNNRFLTSNFMHTQDYKIKAKSVEGVDLTPQKFWMFHRVDRKEIYVVFTSQKTSAYILSDADVWKMPRQKDIVLVDNIPVSLFQGLLLQDYHLVFTGHSLGGAIAILTTCKLVMKVLDAEQINKIRCITFGAPQVSYQNLGQILKFDELIFRYELPKDPVPQLLTAFQRDYNPCQEFLISLMNLLGLQHSFKHEDDLDIGLKDFVHLDKSRVEDIKINGKLGTVFVPQKKGLGNFQMYYMAHEQEWHYLINLNLTGSKQQTKLYFSEFIGNLLGEHQFERYLQELFQLCLNNIKLQKVITKPIAWDMAQFRIPGSPQWTCNPLNLDHPNQVEAFFDEMFTKVFVISKHPHVLGIRFGEIQQYSEWGKAPAQIQQDRGVYIIMFIFYSADSYEDLKRNSLIKIKLCGCFETIENVEIKAEQSCDDDASQIRGSAYDDMYLQQLYTSAFQASLFAGEGHNPMLAKNQSQKQRNTQLQEDHYSLVENLGSLIVNQKFLEIILKENEGQFQNKWLKEKIFNTCDTKIFQDFSAKKKDGLNKKKLVDIAKKNLNEIYNSFKFNPKEQSKTSTTKKRDAKTCVQDSIPTLFSLSCSLIWQMKMFLWSEALIATMAGGGAVAGAGAVAQEFLAGVAGIAAGTVTTVTGGIAFAGVCLFAFIYSLSTTGVKFLTFFKNFEEMQRQYKLKLRDLLKKFGYKVKVGHSVAVLENKLSKLCQWLFQQDEIGYSYNNSERELNQKILEYILETNNSQDRAAKVEMQLKQLIDKKIKFLSNVSTFENLKITTLPSRGLAALLLFICNNYRIRLCLSKTLRIGVVGSKNAGKSTLCKMLGCAIERTGENQCTEDATIYQNVPVNNFCVVDYPHLDNVVANNTMKVFYSLSDITIIVMKSQHRAVENQQNLEIGEIIKAVQMKYNQSGYGNNRRWPVLLLFNQVDKMIFDSNGDDQPDQELSENFKELQSEIFDNLKDQGIDQNKVWCLFSSLEPELPKPSPEKVSELLEEPLSELQTQLITKQISSREFTQKNVELVQKISNSVDKQRLQNITKCSFFDWQQDHTDNPETIVNTLAKMVQNLGDKQGANSIIDSFNKNNH